MFVLKRERAFPAFQSDPFEQTKLTNANPSVLSCLPNARQRMEFTKIMDHKFISVDHKADMVVSIRSGYCPLGSVSFFAS